jgi:hypothetical protein
MHLHEKEAPNKARARQATRGSVMTRRRRSGELICETKEQTMSVFLRRLRASRAVLVLVVLGALIGATGAGAGPAVSTTSPFTYMGENPCAAPPEAFTGTGTLHFLTSENLSTSGAIQFHLNARIDGLKAVTLTGKRYVVQDTFNWEFVISRATEETFDLTAHFVRVGEDGSLVLGDDFYEYIRTHITANANGLVTAFHVDMQDVPCQ